MSVNQKDSTIITETNDIIIKVIQTLWVICSWPFVNHFKVICGFI